MMDAIKFMKADFMKMKTQLLLIVLTVSVVLIFNGKMGTLWGAMYMVFMGLIFCSVPFSIDIANGESFMKLLPAKPQQRVYGRFCFAVLFLALCIAAISLSYMPGFLNGTIKAGNILPKVIMIFSAGLCMNTIQYVCSYFFEIKNQQWLSMIRMVPGFIFLFGGTYLVDSLAAMPQEMVETLGKGITYAMTHQWVPAVIFLLCSLIFTMVCAAICGKREAMKEA